MDRGVESTYWPKSRDETGSKKSVEGGRGDDGVRSGIWEGRVEGRWDGLRRSWSGVVK
jgi:hypothetical protein